jgi:hypothetical protein
MTVPTQVVERSLRFSQRKGSDQKYGLIDSQPLSNYELHKLEKLCNGRITEKADRLDRPHRN